MAVRRNADIEGAARGGDGEAIENLVIGDGCKSDGSTCARGKGSGEGGGKSCESGESSDERRHCLLVVEGVFQTEIIGN